MSALSMTKEVYRKIFTELINTLKEDSSFQRELNTEKINFIEQVHSIELAQEDGGIEYLHKPESGHPQFYQPQPDDPAASV